MYEWEKDDCFFTNPIGFTYFSSWFIAVIKGAHRWARREICLEACAFTRNDKANQFWPNEYEQEQANTRTSSLAGGWFFAASAESETNALVFDYASSVVPLISDLLRLTLAWRCTNLIIAQHERNGLPNSQVTEEQSREGRGNRSLARTIPAASVFMCQTCPSCGHRCSL